MASPSTWRRLKSDPRYRRRFIHSVSIFWTFLGMGWCHGITGPTFPDLRQITKQDLDTGSWIYTSGSIGFLLGSLAGGVLYSRFNRLLLLGISSAISGVTMAMKPWCELFPLLIVVGTVGSFSAGILDMGGNAEMVSVWEGDEGNMYMQILHFFFAIGGIISPLLAKPFLAPTTCISYTTDNQTEQNTTIIQGGAVAGQNVTGCVESFGETRIHTPYVISGLIMFSGCVPFLIIFLKSDRNKNSKHEKDHNDNGQGPWKLSINIKVTMMILLSAFMVFYCAVEDGFIGFLMTFCLRQLRWTKDYGSYASSVFWTAFSAGRFIGIFLAKRFSSKCLLFTYLSFIIISFIGLLISSLMLTHVLPWIFIPLAGFSMSVVFPCIFSWTESRVMRVTGMITSMLMISSGSSGMVNPLVFGYMMDNFSPMWFTYLLLAAVTMCMLLLIVMNLVLRCCVRDTRQTREEDIEQEMTFIGGMQTHV